MTQARARLSPKKAARRRERLKRIEKETTTARRQAEDESRRRHTAAHALPSPAPADAAAEAPATAGQTVADELVCSICLQAMAGACGGDGGEVGAAGARGPAAAPAEAPLMARIAPCAHLTCWPCFVAQMCRIDAPYRCAECRGDAVVVDKVASPDGRALGSVRPADGPFADADAVESWAADAEARHRRCQCSSAAATMRTLTAAAREETAEDAAAWEAAQHESLVARATNLLGTQHVAAMVALALGGHAPTHRLPAPNDIAWSLGRVALAARLRQACAERLMRHASAGPKYFGPTEVWRVERLAAWLDAPADDPASERPAARPEALYAALRARGVLR